MLHALIDAPQSHPSPQLAAGDSFHFTVPAFCFEDLSKSAEGRQRRIRGVISDEARDLQQERVLQRGLDFTEFLGQWGYFNLDHGKNWADVIGAAESVQYYEPNAALPDGKRLPYACTWCEGAFSDDVDGKRVYDKAISLQALNRSVGFSIQGRVTERSEDGRDILAASVQHVAITHQPINRDARLGELLRSLAVGAGTPGPPQPVAPGAYAGPDAGRALMREDLDPRLVSLDVPSGRRKRRKKAKSSPAPGEILESIYRALPGVSPDYALGLLARMRPQRAR